MINVALYGLMRVLVEWLAAPSALARDRRPRARRDLGARRHPRRALPARAQTAARVLLDRERRDLLLGLGAALVLRARGERGLGVDRARRRAAAHAEPRALQGAAVPRRRLVRRAPCTASSSTGSAGCCAGCHGRAARSSSARLASPGIAPLGGFVSEWLTLQALLHLALGGSVAAGVSGALALAGARDDRRALRLLLRQGLGLVLLGAAPAAGLRARRRGAARRCASASSCSPAGASSSPSCPAAMVDALARILPGCASSQLARRGSTRPARGGLPALALALALGARRRRCSRCRAAAPRRAPAPAWASGQRVEPALQLDERRLHEAGAARARSAPATRARARRRRARRHRAVRLLPRRGCRC